MEGLAKVNLLKVVDKIRGTQSVFVQLVYGAFQPKILTFCGLALYVSYMKKYPV
jgi:hypothetical protein